MPQGTFVPSHCSSFSPKQRALFYTWIHFIQQLAVFFKHIFTARLTTGLLCALLPDSHHSHAPTHKFAPVFVLFFFVLFFFSRERFNLQSFIGLGFIWSCERCGRIKKQHRTREEKGSQDFWRAWRVFGAPWREKRERAGRGQKIQLLDCAVLTLFMCPSFEIFTDFSAVSFFFF